MFRIVNQILFYVSGCFYYLSSTLNPLLYNVMSSKYRQAFKAVMTCRKLREDPNPDHLQLSPPEGPAGPPSEQPQQ